MAPRARPCRRCGIADTSWRSRSSVTMKRIVRRACGHGPIVERDVAARAVHEIGERERDRHVARRGPSRAQQRRPARGRPAATPARRGAPRDRGGSPCGRSTYTRAGVPSGAATSRTAARTGAESSRTAVAPPCAGVTSKRRSSAASPRAATRRHAPNGTVHHRRPLATAGKEWWSDIASAQVSREDGGGEAGAGASSCVVVRPVPTVAACRARWSAAFAAARAFLLAIIRSVSGYPASILASRVGC